MLRKGTIISKGRFTPCKFLANIVIKSNKGLKALSGLVIIMLPKLGVCLLKLNKIFILNYRNGDAELMTSNDTHASQIKS